MPANPFTDPLFARVALVVAGALLVLLAGALLREWRRRRGRTDQRSLLVPLLTATVIVTVLTLALFAGGIVLVVVSAAVGAAGATEYAGLTALDRPYRVLLVAWSAGSPAAAALWHSVHVLVVLPLTVFLAVASVPVLSAGVIGTHRQAGAAVFGYLYIGLPMAFLVALQAEPVGLQTLLVVIAGAWLADTCAYAVGGRVGGPKLAPTVSPAKTWSGAIGGGLGAIAGVALLHTAVAAPGGPVYVLALGAVTGIGAVLGDLIESAVKRDWNVKDAGALLPGFGGVLDRFDSLLITIPAAYYLLIWRS